MRRRRKASSSAGGAEHPHSRRRIRGRDLFFCFSSQPSAGAPSSAAAAAMRAPSSKSVLSPGRGREASSAGPSLSSSLSRRLRSSGSVKGGQSPMFPSVVGGRRKGVAFEAAEPSSPKVTCIGQVRVKSKKKAAAAAAAAAKGKGLAMRSRSMRGSEIEASFRRTEGIGGVRECLPSRNQRWVYQLPVSICEALRAIGSEFNCFSPCGGRSLCSSSRSGEAKETEKRLNSCGAALARWLMAVPDSDDGKRGEMVSVVVDDRKQRERTMLVKERIDGEDLDLETREEVLMVLEKGENKEEEEARVSICIPPKNALLLMRCRSDPVQMAALASRFWESPAMQVRVEEGDGKGDEDGSDGAPEREKRDFEVAKDDLKSQGDEGSDRGAILIAEEATEETMQLIPDESKPSKDEDLSRTQEELAVTDAEKAHSEEIENKTPLADKKADEKGRRAGGGGGGGSSAMEKGERRPNRHSSRSKETGKRCSSASRERDRRRHSFSADREVGRSTCSSDKEARRASFSVEAKARWSFSIEKDDLRLGKEVKMAKEEFSAKEKGTTNKVVVQNSPRIEEKEKYGEVIDRVGEEKEVGSEEAGEKKEPEKKSTALPDCLLLMMYEPKLSMEVSKETWVCSEDFLQWQLHHPNYRPRHPSKATAAIGNTTDTSTAAAAAAGGSQNDTRSAALNEAKKDEINGGITIDRRMENKEAVISIPQPPPPPAPPSAPAAAEKKPRINAGAAPTPPVPPSAYGPLVLTRCKSEPMRPSAKLTPDACFWKDRHRPIGATGIGF